MRNHNYFHPTSSDWGEASCAQVLGLRDIRALLHELRTYANSTVEIRRNVVPSCSFVRSVAMLPAILLALALIFVFFPAALSTRCIIQLCCVRSATSLLQTPPFPHAKSCRNTFRPGCPIPVSWCTKICVGFFPTSGRLRRCTVSLGQS